MTFCTQCGSALGPDDVCTSPRCSAAVPATNGAGEAAPTEPTTGHASNPVYSGIRLVYDADPTTYLSGDLAQTVWRPALKRIRRKLFRAVLAAWLLAAILAALSGEGVLAAIAEGSSSALSGLLLTLFVMATLIAVALVLLAPERVLVSEWMTLVDGAGPVAESVLAHGLGSLAAREAPVATRVRRVAFAGGPFGVGRAGGPAARNYLFVRLGSFTAYVSSFAFGRDLYAGWTLWWEERAVVVVWSATRYWFLALLDRPVLFHLVLRSDTAKALREVVHAATRDAVASAVSDKRLMLADTAGGDVPTETVVALAV